MKVIETPIYGHAGIMYWVIFVTHGWGESLWGCDNVLSL